MILGKQCWCIGLVFRIFQKSVIIQVLTRIQIRSFACMGWRQQCWGTELTHIILIHRQGAEGEQHWCTVLSHLSVKMKKNQPNKGSLLYHLGMSKFQISEISFKFSTALLNFSLQSISWVTRSNRFLSPAYPCNKKEHTLMVNCNICQIILFQRLLDV